MNVVLVDGTNCLIRNHFAHAELRSPSGAPTGAVYGVSNRVREAVDAFRPSRVVVCWDGGRSPWRRAALAGYKNRPPSDLSPAFAECFSQKPVVADFLARLGVDQVTVPDVEADDVVAHLALSVDDGGGVHVIIMSTDRDFYQLVGPGVRVYYGAGPDARNVTADAFDVRDRSLTFRTPAEWLAYRIVNGDSSDKIPGVRGLSGEKRWTRVWEVLVGLGYAGDAVDFFLGQEVVGVGRTAHVGLEATVAECWNLLERNCVLMDLRFAVSMLPAAYRAAPDDYVTAGRWDERAVERLCGRLNFQRALRDWTDWRATFAGLGERA